MSMPEFPERRLVNMIDSSGSEPSRAPVPSTSATAASVVGRDVSSGPASRDRAGGIFPDGGTVRFEEHVKPTYPDGIFPRGTPTADRVTFCLESGVRRATGLSVLLGAILPIRARVGKSAPDVRAAPRAGALTVRL